MSRRWRQVPLWVRYLLPPVIFAVGIAGVGLGLALVYVGDEGRKSILVEVGKLCAQFIVLVLLGLLVTGSWDQLRAKETELRTKEGESLAAARERREAHVRRLKDLTQEVDLARLQISTNRSLRVWSEQMNNRLIPAYTELRELAHEAKIAAAAGEPLFADGDKILSDLQSMTMWLHALCMEFTDNKKEMSELVLQAERDNRQGDAWARMQAFPLLGDLVFDGPRHHEFRKAYRRVLMSMSSEFSESEMPRGSRSQEEGGVTGSIRRLIGRQNRNQEKG